jgi:hypothetical protein
MDNTYNIIVGENLRIIARDPLKSSWESQAQVNRAVVLLSELEAEHTQMSEYRRIVAFPTISNRQQEIYAILKIFFGRQSPESTLGLPLGPYMETGPDNEPGVYYGEYKNGLKHGSGKMVVS